MNFDISVNIDEDPAIIPATHQFLISFSMFCPMSIFRLEKSLQQHHRIAARYTAGAVFQDPRALRPGPWGNTSRYRLPVLPAADVGTPQMDKFHGHKKGSFLKDFFKDSELGFTRS